MQKHSLKIVVFLAVCVFSVACSERPSQTRNNQTKAPVQYIINCQSECSQVEKNIRQAGGNITNRYSNLNFLAFEINPANQQTLLALSKYRLVKDRQIAKPRPYEQQNLHISDASSIKTVAPGTVNQKPANYVFKNVKNGAAVLHAQQIFGDGVIVAVIDSGTANNPEVVPTLEGNVIGGENFVPDDSEPSATSTLNDEHGTWVGSMIAAHASITLDKTHELAQAITAYAPESVVAIDDTQVEVPMQGTAPGAKIYALKTFGVNSPGAPSSRVIAAMDRVLTLKQNFNNGVPSEPIAGDGSEEDPFVYDSLDIKVLNLSLGGPALFPGGELEDLITDALLQAGVVVVTSAGNEGPSAITGGSPGTALSALTVGAASDPVHERILREIQLGPGMGGLFRPLDNLVISSFSSRGPTADGRIGVDLVANGVATFVQGADGHISVVSGTSFSSPTVAGVAALLWQAFPDKSAIEIRNAIIEGANSELMQSIATPYDQGHGFLNAFAAYQLLENSTVASPLPTAPLGDVNSIVSNTLAQMQLDIVPASEPQISRWHILEPGQVVQLFIESDMSIEALQLDIKHVVPLQASQNQNELTGDNVIFSLVDAPLSVDNSLLRETIDHPQAFEFAFPQNGLLRLAVMGNWKNKGKVLVSFDINKVLATNVEPVVTGSISDGGALEYKFEVTDAMTNLNFILQWNGNWSQYPAHDVDLLLVDPAGNLIFDGATLNSPEMAFLETPAAGTWTAIVDGFLLHDFSDEFMLFVTDQDNNPVIPTN